MDEKQVIKNIDLLFKKISDFNTFSINNILVKELKPNNKNSNEVQKFFDTINEVKLFGMNNGLFIKYNENDWFSLTDKGKDLKQSNLSFLKFSKKTKPKKFDLYKIVPIILTVIFGISTFYFAYINHHLRLQELKSPSLQLKVDSLKKELNHIKNKMIEYKEKPLLDTLQTKNQSF